MLHDRRHKVDIVPQPFAFKAVERPDLQVGGFAPRRRPGDELGDHRVLKDRPLAPFIDPFVDPPSFDPAPPLVLAILVPSRHPRLSPPPPPPPPQHPPLGSLLLPHI